VAKSDGNRPGGDEGITHTLEIFNFRAKGTDRRLSRPVRAREEQADKLFREIIEIADDASGDYVTTSDGKRHDEFARQLAYDEDGGVLLDGNGDIVRAR
jgi:hypothetical protein